MVILIIVSSRTQVEMFKCIVSGLKDFKIKFVNIEVEEKDAIEELLARYKFKFETIERVNSDFAFSVLRREKPDIILTGNDQIFMDILLIQAANQMKIPSLTIQDGVLTLRRYNDYMKRDLKYYLRLPLKFIDFFLIKRIPLRYILDLVTFGLKHEIQPYGHGDSTKIAVFGESVREMFISEEISPDKIVVTGNPKFDRLKKFSEKSITEDLKKKFDIPPDKTVISVFTQYLVELGYWKPAQRKEFVSEIAKAVLKLDDAHLIFKIHPIYEKKEDYHEILSKFPISHNIFKYEPSEEILDISDIVMAVFSTIALESMVLGKTTMVVNIFKDEEPKFYKDSGAIYIEEKNQILPNLRKLSSGKNIVDTEKVEDFVFSQTYKIDGKSSQRIADLIARMIEDNSH